MVLHVEEDVRVGVEGDAYGALAKEFLKRSWVISSRKEQCGEVVEADVVQPNRKQQRFEGQSVYVGRVKELTSLCSEYEVLIALQGICAGDQICPYRHQPGKPVLALDLTPDEVSGSSLPSATLEVGSLKPKRRGRGPRSNRAFYASTPIFTTIIQIFT